MQDASREVFVDELVKEFLVAIVEATRRDEDVSLGCSPRGSISLFRSGQALALVRGRDFVLPDDIKELAEAVLSHRMIVSAAARMRGVRGSDVVRGIVDRVPVPGAQVSYTVTKRARWRWWNPWIRPMVHAAIAPSFWWPGVRDEVVATGTTTTASDGSASISFRAGSSDYDADYEITANVVDLSNREVSGSFTVPVTRAAHAHSASVGNR